ncbi:MAG: hypothetical protein PUH24_04990 [Prevotellaceae bacterium]|nr:hypothetical protein [Prevotellaceae bacterium]
MTTTAFHPLLETTKLHNNFLTHEHLQQKCGNGMGLTDKNATNINKSSKSFNMKNGRFLKKVPRASKYAILRAFGKRLAYSELKNIDKSCPVIYAYSPCNLCQITM